MNSPSPRARDRLVVRSRASHSVTFEEVLANGPTNIPDRSDMNAALESLMPNESGRRVPDAKAVAGNEHIDSDGHNDDYFRHGIIGWALSPMWMGVDALRWAGQTVNDKALAPVVRYASPAGWLSYAVDSVKNLTPQRARDLARIFGNAAVNSVNLAQIPAGQKAQNSGLRALDAFVSAISSPRGRQLVIDCSTTFVKVAEAIDTPEAKDAIQQMAVTAARFLDVLASDETKIGIQALADCVCHLGELANSSEATIMAAEFTANVVHALEMEHSVHDLNKMSVSHEPVEPLVADYEGTIIDKFIDPTTPIKPAKPGNISTIEIDEATAKSSTSVVSFEANKISEEKKKVEQSSSNEVVQVKSNAEGDEKKAKLPRYTREHFEKVLTKRLKPLCQQMEAPNMVSLEGILSDAASAVNRKEKKETLPNQPKDNLLLALCILTGVALWTLFGFYGVFHLLSSTTKEEL